MNTKKQSTKLLRNQKPIEHDIHLRYLCQNCGQSHWLSYAEASTKKFKIVCYCGHTFGVKLVVDFKLKYSKSLKKSKSSNIELSIPNDILLKGISQLKSYGFTDTESKDLLIKTYTSNPTDDLATLIKQTLISIRG